MIEKSGNISHKPVVRFNPHSCGILSKPLSIKANRDFVASTKRLLIMFKPDCLSLEMVPEGLQLLKQGLDREKINFRFAGLVLLNLTPQLTDRIYSEHVGKTWYEGINKLFMTGNHPNKNAVQAPIIAAMLEIKNETSRDVIGIIRKNIIGPTDVEEHPDKNAIKNTIRYKLILEKGLLTWPFPEDPNGPNYNRIHCSADEKAAGGELFPLFGIRGILSALYTPSAAQDVLSSWGKQSYAEVPGVIRIPLHEYLGADPAIFSKKIIKALNDNGCQYTDFDVIKAEKLIRSLNDMQEMILGKQFFFNQVITSSTGSTSSPNPSKPRVVAIFGAPGSGKTTVSDILKSKGVVNSILPLIVNAEREKSGASKYILKPKAEILRMMGDGELIGWEALAGNYYAISKETVDMITGSPGKTFALLAGPTIVYPLREALRGKADFYQVMLKVPPKDLASRIKARATVRDKERGVVLSLETQKWLEVDIGNFDLTAENANNASEAAAQRLSNFLADPKSIKYDDKREASTLAVTYPYNAVEMFKDQRHSYSNKDIVLLEKQVLARIAPLIRKMLLEVRRSLPAETDLGVDFDLFLSDLTLHTTKVLTTGIQLRSFAYKDIIANQIKLGRIGMCSSKDRALDFYRKMKKIQDSIPLEEEMLFDIVHDIGKMEDIIHHPERGYEIAKKLKIFEGWGIKGMDPDIALIALKCSHLISSYLLPDYSLIAVGNELAHEDIKNVLARRDGSVDMGRMRKFMDRICFFPNKDVSGYKDGWLNVLFSEGYFAFGDWLYSIFKKNSGNYDNAIAEIKEGRAKFNMDRVVKCVAMEDMEANVNDRTFDFYRDNIVLPNVEACINEGVFTKADWDLVMGNLHHISKFRYTTTQITDFLQFIGAKSEKVEDFNNFGNMFKLFVIMTKSLIAFSKDPFRPGTFEFKFTYDDGREIVAYSNYGEAMNVLNDQLKLSKSDIVRSGKSILLAPKEKTKLPSAEITEELEDGNRIISFKLKGFFPPKTILKYS